MLLRASRSDINRFLDEVRDAIGAGQWTFVPREKNMAVLMELGLRPLDVKDELVVLPKL